jgi:type IV pilus assembly protein PilE
MKGRGFTLIELMVAVAVIAILAATAVPAYRDYSVRAQLVDATAALADQRVRMEQFYADNRHYGSGTCGATLPILERFVLSCELSAEGQGYVVTAAGRTDSLLNGFKYSIDQANRRVTVAWGAGWGSVPAAGETRWLIRKE